VPHPLSNFAGPNFVDGLFADIILDFIHDTVWEGAESMRYKAACWFLLESEMAFFFACSEAGIDANRLRSHLRKHLPNKGGDAQVSQSGKDSRSRRSGRVR
jgi:hypothetical protein